MIRLLRPRGQRWHRYDPTIIVPLLVLSIVLAATTAHAQTTTWTGGGTSNNWSDSGNWDNGVPQNGYDVYFSPVSTDSYVDIPGLTLNRLDMNGYSGTLWLDEDISTADYCRIDGFFYTGEQSLNVGTDLIVMNSGGFSADFTNISVANSLSIAGYIAFYFATIDIGHNLTALAGTPVMFGPGTSIMVGESVELDGVVLVDDQATIKIDGVGGVFSVPSDFSLQRIEIALASALNTVDMMTVGSPFSIRELDVSNGVLDLSGANITLSSAASISAGGEIRSPGGNNRYYEFTQGATIDGGVLAITAPGSTVMIGEFQTVDVNGTGLFLVDGEMGSGRITLGSTGTHWEIHTEPTATAYIRDANIQNCGAVPPLTVHSCGNLGGNVDITFVEPDISLSDTTVSFVDQLIGKTALDTVFVKNIGTDTLVVSSLSNDLPEFTTTTIPTPFVVLPSESVYVEIAFLPLTEGSYVDSLEVASDDPDEGLVKVYMFGGSVAPDLEPIAFNAPPELRDGGGQIMPLFTCWNIGTGETGMFRASIRISEDAVIDTNDVVVVSTHFPSFPPNWAGGISTPVSIPKDAPRGNVYLGGFADDLDDVLESNEDNNTISVPFSYQVPLIYSVIDVPSDQGGSVFLSWYASPRDPQGDITEYTLWRTIDVPPAASEGAVMLHSAAEWTPHLGDHVVRVQDTPAGPVFWEHIATHGAFRRDAYGMELPTMFDSTGAGFQYHYYQVIAHTAAPDTFYLSAPDSGYSVDNLAPAAPQNVAAEQSDPRALLITWDANSEADLSHYAVYRGTDAGFDPGPENRVGEPGDPQFEDSQWEWDGGYYYKITALDIHGNESPVATAGPEVIVGVAQTGPPRVNYLGHSRPNPFSSDMRIDYGLAEAADVSITVYDVAGRLVRTLVDARRGPDNYAVHWDGRDDAGRRVAGGVYFYRIVAGDFVQTKKATLLR